MRRVLFAVAALGMCVVLGSCAMDQGKRAYMGKWEGKAEDKGFVMEFLDSDVVLVTIEDETKAGKWVVDAKGNVKIVFDEDSVTGRMLDKERLLLTQDAGDNAVVLKRAK